MGKIYYKNNLDLNYTIIFIPELTQECIDFNLDCFLQEAFENCFELNDIDILNNDLCYMSYLKNKSLIILKNNAEFVCFGTIDLKPSLNGVGFSLYLSKFVNVKRFSYIFHILMTTYLKIIVTEEIFYNYKDCIYFDVASLVIYKWAKKILPSLTKNKIRKEYIICYTSINTEHIKNIILKDIEIYKC